jgi:hypothetical protein
MVFTVKDSHGCYRDIFYGHKSFPIPFNMTHLLPDDLNAHVNVHKTK